MALFRLPETSDHPGYPVDEPKRDEETCGSDEYHGRPYAHRVIHFRKPLGEHEHEDKMRQSTQTSKHHSQPFDSSTHGKSFFIEPTKRSDEMERSGISFAHSIGSILFL